MRVRESRWIELQAKALRHHELKGEIHAQRRRLLELEARAAAHSLLDELVPCTEQPRVREQLGDDVPTTERGELHTPAMTALIQSLMWTHLIDQMPATAVGQPTQELS